MNVRLLTRSLTAIVLLCCACVPAAPPPPPTATAPRAPTAAPATPAPTVTATVTATATATVTVTPSPTPVPPVPDFSHIILLIFENREFTSTIGNPQMPNFNHLARQYTLLSQHYAIRHPSLPNYLALIGGDTFNVQSNCENCTVDAPSLPDLIEASGRSWKTYQENMPQPCFPGSSRDYAQKHNPFVYFDPIRLDQPRCQRSVVPLSAIDADLAQGQLPNFVFITPDICNSAHDCGVEVSDRWLGVWIERLLSYPGVAQNGLIIVTWDEGQGEHTCCGLETGGGRIATLLISPHARRGFEDDTPYTHYSILKTIASAWGLPELGHAADAQTALIRAPWQR